METIAVAGLGLLGRGISASLLAHGFHVVAYAPDSAEFQPAESSIERALQEMIGHDALETTQARSWRPRWLAVDSIQGMAGADFVIESIVENLDVKREFYRSLEAVIAPNTPIATNTSSLPIRALQPQLDHPERLIGMHWAEPAYATRFLELACGPLTSEATAHAAQQLGLRLGKDPCMLAVDLPGLLANRLGYAVYREALHLLQLGVADAETIDRSFRNSFGLWAAVCGPLRWIDLTGGPALYLKAMENVLPSLSNSTSAYDLAQSVVNVDAVGAKAGAGFYAYAPGEAEQWEIRFRNHTWEVKKIQDREFSLPEQE